MYLRRIWILFSYLGIYLVLVSSSVHKIITEKSTSLHKPLTTCYYCYAFYDHNFWSLWVCLTYQLKEPCIVFVFRLKFITPGTQCTFQFLRDLVTPSGSEVFMLLCDSLSVPLEVKEAMKLDRTIGLRH